MSERCPVCGAFMREFDDYTHEGVVEGSFFECINPRHTREEVNCAY